MKTCCIFYGFIVIMPNIVHLSTLFPLSAPAMCKNPNYNLSDKRVQFQTLDCMNIQITQTKTRNWVNWGPL